MNTTEIRICLFAFFCLGSNLVQEEKICIVSPANIDVRGFGGSVFGIVWVWVSVFGYLVLFFGSDIKKRYALV